MAIQKNATRDESNTTGVTTTANAADTAANEAAIAITMLPVDQLKQSGWNPNVMPAEAYAAFAKEVKKIRRIPKPIVVFKSKNDYVIDDGEQSWMAARDGDLKFVPCEIIDVDKFEAMRQTIVRNRHGDNNAVLLGRLYEKMLKVGKLSNRELAKKLDTTEGTIRNYLDYAKAEELRNGYAPKDALELISKLHVKQIEAYLKLPPEKRDDWLDSGGLLEGAAKLMPPKPGAKKVAAASTSSKAASAVPDVDVSDAESSGDEGDDSGADDVSDAESSADEGAETSADDDDGDTHDDQDDSSAASGEDGDDTDDTPAAEPVAQAFDKKVLQELEDAWGRANEATRKKFLAGIMADSAMLKYIRQLLRQGA